MYVCIAQTSVVLTCVDEQTCSDIEASEKEALEVTLCG